METKEIWKDIKGYENIYEINNYGYVKSLKRMVNNRNNYVEERIMSLEKTKHGYLRVILSKENTQKKCLVHRLVAKAFIPNLENKPEVNHKDGNKKNNYVENLEWSTCSENIIHSYNNNLRKPSKPHTKKVKCIENNKIYDSLSDCEKDLKISRKSIRNSCIYNRKIFNTYSFVYVN